MPAPGSPFPAAPGAYTMAIGDINEDGFGATSIDMGYGGEGNAVKKTR